MRFSLFIASLATAAYAQGVTQYIAPPGNPPKGCETSKDGKFELSVEPLGKKNKRMAFEASAMLRVKLAKGVLTDDEARTGYVADNFQFQFDGPPQAGALFTGGWSFCRNGSLALGPSTIFYQCLSGSFYNLYDRWWAAQCSPIHIVAHSLAPSAPAPVSVPAGALGGVSGSTASATGLGLDGGIGAAKSSPAKATGTAAITTSIIESPIPTNDPLLGAPNATASISLLSSVSSSISSESVSLSSDVASVSAKASAAVSKSSSAAKTSATSNVGFQVGLSGASNVALLMGVLGMVIA